MPKLYDTMRKMINDPSIEVVANRTGRREPGKPSGIDNELFHSFEAAQKTMFPGAITLPQLRPKGVQAHGFGPIVDEKDVTIGAAHTDDERLAGSSLYQEVEFLWRSVLPLVASK